MTAIPASITVAAPPRLRCRTRLTLKFALAFIGLVTLVLLINGAVNVWLSYEEAKRATVRAQREKAQAAAERIDLFVSGIEQQIGWTTRADWARTSSEQRRYDFIRLLRQVPAITQLVHVGGDGKEQLRLSRLEPDVVAGGSDYIRDIFKAEESRPYLGNTVEPVKNASTEAAACRPSRMAQTTSDWPRRMSPQANTFSAEDL